MKALAFLAALLSASIGLTVAVAADGVGSTQLRVLYIGNPQTDRGRAYAHFLGEHFDLTGTIDRKRFDPRSAKATEADVVVLDWSQSDIEHTDLRAPGGPEAHLKSPLGERSTWSKPTVLLGSAGHLIAAPWRVFGGSG